MKTKPKKGKVKLGNVTFTFESSKLNPGDIPIGANPAETYKRVRAPEVAIHLEDFSCEEIQNYLKEKYGLGTFNLNYVFMYKPTEEGALTYQTDPIKA